ncbi:MAG: hypothetical protein GY851_17835 [bacterium]|nr:hypothetical protein [bacterium]
MAMTRRERLMAVFSGDGPDRPPVKLWNVCPGQALLHPAYEPVRDAGVASTDLMVGGGMPFDLYCGRLRDDHFFTREQPTDSDEWVDIVTDVRTPEGDLRSVYRRSTCNKPGYEMEELLKEPGDIKKLMSLPYEPYPSDPAPFREQEAAMGDAGIVVFGLDHAMYGLQRQIGSENFALWSISDPDPMLDAVAEFANRIEAHIHATVDTGLRPVFGWVGPELCIPPLMGPADFDRYVGAFDKPLIDLIHEEGCYVWVHSHGKMGPVLERFADMGVDVLNPIEPPPMGDLTLPEAFERVGGRMGLEGNIETHDIMTSPPDELRSQIREALEAGKGRRFILCPSSGYMEDPEPTERFIENLMVYVQDGVRMAESMA